MKLHHHMATKNINIQNINTQNINTQNLHPTSLHLIMKNLNLMATRATPLMPPTPPADMNTEIKLLMILKSHTDIQKKSHTESHTENLMENQQQKTALIPQHLMLLKKDTESLKESQKESHMESLKESQKESLMESLMESLKENPMESQKIKTAPTIPIAQNLILLKSHTKKLPTEIHTESPTAHPAIAAQDLPTPSNTHTSQENLTDTPNINPMVKNPMVKNLKLIPKQQLPPPLIPLHPKLPLKPLPPLNPLPLPLSQKLKQQPMHD